MVRDLDRHVIADIGLAAKPGYTDGQNLMPGNVNKKGKKANNEYSRDSAADLAPGEDIAHVAFQKADLAEWRDYRCPEHSQQPLALVPRRLVTALQGGGQQTRMAGG